MNPWHSHASARATKRTIPTHSPGELEKLPDTNSLALVRSTLSLVCLHANNTCLGSGCFQPVVALLFKFQRQLLATLFGNSPVSKHMHKLRHYVVKQALIMCHENDGIF